MRKVITIAFVTSFIIIIIFFTTFNYVYAKNNDIKNKWEVTITNDAKDINDTHKIKFEVQKNENVIPGKIAPEMKAIAEIDIDLQKIDGFVDIKIEFDDSKLNNVFLLNTKFDDEYVSTKTIERVEAGRIARVLLELEWNGNDTEDTKIGIDTKSIELPIKIEVLQNI